MSNCSKQAWHVPAEREPGVLYMHGHPGTDYAAVQAIEVDGQRFERERTCHVVTEYVEAALGQGTLTAEDVRSFLNRNSVFDDTTWTHGRQELVFDEDDLQAMADELNATLGRGKCRIEHYGMGYYCSKCGNEVGSDDPEDEQCIDANAIELWSFCPRCGREVVDA